LMNLNVFSNLHELMIKDVCVCIYVCMYICIYTHIKVFGSPGSQSVLLWD